jgi:hypothetical protein
LMVVFVLIDRLRRCVQGLCHTSQTAFVEVPDTKTSQIEVL